MRGRNGLAKKKTKLVQWGIFLNSTALLFHPFWPLIILKRRIKTLHKSTARWFNVITRVYFTMINFKRTTLCLDIFWRIDAAGWDPPSSENCRESERERERRRNNATSNWTTGLIQWKGFGQSERGREREGEKDTGREGKLSILSRESIVQLTNSPIGQTLNRINLSGKMTKLGRFCGMIWHLWLIPEQCANNQQK